MMSKILFRMSTTDINLKRRISTAREQKQKQTNKNSPKQQRRRRRQQ